MPAIDAIIFDFDGVLLESEFEGNIELARLLTDLGHGHTVEETLRHYVGLAGRDFIEAIERRIGAPLPPEFHERRRQQSVRGHLQHLGLADAFGDHIYSGREHVERGKPAPDLYLHAAMRLEVDIRRSAIIEDSEVGVTGALASGATVVGLAAGRHCLDGHAEMLRSLGAEHVAQDFDEVARLLGLTQTRR
jgi:HAD superfamily hydrolase (TIGR01509 family)